MPIKAIYPENIESVSMIVRLGINAVVFVF